MKAFGEGELELGRGIHRGCEIHNFCWKIKVRGENRLSICVYCMMGREERSLLSLGFIGFLLMNYCMMKFWKLLVDLVYMCCYE